MPIEVDAIYEGGTFRPLQKLPLAENQRVKLTVKAIEEANAGKESDWWSGLKQILGEQEARGFEGSITEFNRDDEAYEQRMAGIYRNTRQAESDG